MRCCGGLLAIACAAAAAGAPTSAAAGGELLVSAAVSLKAPLERLAGTFEDSRPGLRVRLNLAGSGALVAQIERGAEVDLFLSASSVELDRLDAGDLLLPGTRSAVAANRLIIALRREAPRLERFAELVHPRIERIALGNPRTVPAGRYARDALRHLGLWERLEPRLVYAESVRQALDYVSRGEVDAALVYATDLHPPAGPLLAGPLAPPGSHAPILYQAAIPRSAAHPHLAGELLALLRSARGRAVLAAHGFLPPGAP